MKLFGVVLTVAVAISTAALAQEPEVREVGIVKGKSTTITLPFKGATGINSNPSVVEAKVDGKTLILMARSEGWASYTIYSKDKKQALAFEVTVSDRDVNKIKKDLEAMLADFELVTVRIAGGDVIVEGEVATLEELRKINILLAPYERKGGVQNQLAPAQ